MSNNPLIQKLNELNEADTPPVYVHYVLTPQRGWPTSIIFLCSDDSKHVVDCQQLTREEFRGYDDHFRIYYHL